MTEKLGPMNETPTADRQQHLIVERIEPPQPRYGVPVNDAFQAWWLRDGKYIDPDTDDVPWFDKRKALCEMAFHAAMAQSGNYTADKAIEPTEVTFANGRRVTLALREARASLTPLERYDAGHERFQREQIRGLTQTVAALLRQLHRLGCVGRVPSFDVDPEEWASAYDPQTNDTLLHLKSEARAPRPQPGIDLHESRSPDGDGHLALVKESEELSDSIMGHLVPQQGHEHARGGDPNVRVTSFASQGNARAGSNPADSHSFTAAAPLGGPPAGTVHVYLSTACSHDRHDRCRRWCKFCAIACRCACHGLAAPLVADKEPK